MPKKTASADNANPPALFANNDPRTPSGWTPVKRYKGIWIFLLDSRFVFRKRDLELLRDEADEEEGQEDLNNPAVTYFDSCAEATTKIDQLLLLQAKASVQMDLPVVCGDGKMRRIVGVHGSRLHAIVKPKVDTDRNYFSRDYSVANDDLYTPTDWVNEALVEYSRLADRLRCLGEALKLAEIEPHGVNEAGGRFYGNARNEEDVAVAGRKLKEQYADKRKLVGKFQSLAHVLEHLEKQRKKEEVEKEKSRSFGLRTRR